MATERKQQHIRAHNLEAILKIGGVEIYADPTGSYVCFVSDLDICNDGSGPAHGDPHHIKATAYKHNRKYLNADHDYYIVIPPQVRKLSRLKVMGCKSRLTNLTTGGSHDAVCGEIGPPNKTGEASYCLARKVNASVTHNSGDKRRHYLYELWPGVPAAVNGKHYNLV